MAHAQSSVQGGTGSASSSSGTVSSSGRRERQCLMIEVAGTVR